MSSYEIIILKNQGFCYGVKHAVLTVENLLTCNNYPKPIHMLGSLVHNHHVNAIFKERGIICYDHTTRLQMLDEINGGTVIISAHGVSEEVIDKAVRKNLTIIDTTCPHVKKSYQQIKTKINDGFDVIFIGKNNHPEVEAALALGKQLHVLYNLNDIDTLHIENRQLALAIQTTLTKQIFDDFYHKLIARYPAIIPLKQVCQVTTKRQMELSEAAQKEANNDAVIFLVIGDQISSNTMELLGIVSRHQCHGLLISNIEQINHTLLNNYQRVYIISGTSVPKYIVDEIIDYIEKGSR